MKITVVRITISKDEDDKMDLRRGKKRKSNKKRHTLDKRIGLELRQDR